MYDIEFFPPNPLMSAAIDKESLASLKRDFIIKIQSRIDMLSDSWKYSPRYFSSHSASSWRIENVANVGLDGPRRQVERHMLVEQLSLSYSPKGRYAFAWREAGFRLRVCPCPELV